MQFGKVTTPEEIDFSLPLDHIGTKTVLSQSPKGSLPNVYVGCAKWNKTDLKNFYPKGVKDELTYYSSQFNSIEMNASFYRIFPKEQFVKWRERTPDNFKFFPKVSQRISHFKRLKEAELLVDEYVHAIGGLEEKLGCVFLQLHSNFAPKDMERVHEFTSYWPKHIPLAMEFRHTDWYNDQVVFEELSEALQSKNMSNIITDTAGRRDLLHMRLTNKSAFVRYVGANHCSDYTRLDDWIIRLGEWKEQGIENIYFFIHQNVEKESPLLASYFIDKLNTAMGTTLAIPETLIKKSGHRV